jgi:hypothetical protein
MKKHKVSNEYDLPLKSRLNVMDKWYAKPEVKERFIQHVQWFCNDFKEYPVIMEGEFGDDVDNGIIENGDHWDRFPQCKRFSHH